MKNWGLTQTSHSLVLLLLLLAAARADEPLRVVNRGLGYSFVGTGLKSTRRNPQDLQVLRAYVDPKDEDYFEGSRLEIELLKDSDPRKSFGSVASSFVRDQGAKELERGTVELAGRPATRILLKHPDGRLILFLYENAKRPEGAFAMLAHSRGEDPAARMKVIEKAISTFTTDVPEKPAEGTFVDRASGFRIRLEGFEGSITGFQMMFLEMLSLRIGLDHLGTFMVVATHPGRAETRARELPEIRKRLEEAKRKIVSVEKVDLQGRQAARIKAEYTEFGQQNVMEQLVIWDRDAVLYVTSIYRPALAKGREKPLLQAINSFRFDAKK
jgi:hypothetical protein